MRLRFTWFLLILAVTFGLAPPALSQTWPQRPIKIIVPFAPGGNTDGLARIIAQPLSETLGQPVVVENRPGAAGALAAEAVARAPADGHTLLMATPTQLALLPATAKAPYDPVKDFAPIGVIGTNPYVLAVHSSIPARTVAEFVDHVRGQPNKITYAAPVVGGLSHLTMVLFLKRAGIEMVPVGYKGGAAPMTDLVGGHVPVYFALLSDVVSHASSGSVRLLAITSERRLASIPNVPTLIEAGYPGFKAVTWNGLVAPAGTPGDVVSRLAREVSRAVHDPKLAERLAAFGVDPVGNSPEQFGAMIATDLALWAEAIKIAGIQDK
jgi:tripartite-type tricarboxylate transporter receptor subunit TctC